MSTQFISSNLVPPRPKEQARYTIRELLILGLTLPIRFCPITKFGPEALGLDIVSLERINESLLQYEREQLRQLHIAQHQARKRLVEAARARYKREEKEGAKVQHRPPLIFSRDRINCRLVILVPQVKIWKWMEMPMGL